MGAGAGEATSTQTADAGAAVAPGTAIAPTESTTQVLAPNAIRWRPSQPRTGKTRYSYRAKTEAADKAAKKQAAVKQKAAFTPVAATTVEDRQTKTQQAAPLGLNGDTATKKKKRVKGRSQGASAEQAD